MLLGSRIGLMDWWIDKISHRMSARWWPSADALLQVVFWKSWFQLMVGCWFGLVVWIPGIPLWNGLLLCYLGVPLESQTTNPNQQVSISWWFAGKEKRCNKQAHVWHWNLNWWSKTTPIVDLKTKTRFIDKRFLEWQIQTVCENDRNEMSKRPDVRLTRIRTSFFSASIVLTLESVKPTIWRIQESVDCGLYTLPTKKNTRIPYHPKGNTRKPSSVPCFTSTSFMVASFRIWGRNGLEHVANRFSSEIFGGWGGWMRIFTCLRVDQ